MLMSENKLCWKAYNEKLITLEKEILDFNNTNEFNFIDVEQKIFRFTKK